MDILNRYEDLKDIVRTSTDLSTQTLVSCFTPINWTGEKVVLLDQRKLPVEEVSYEAHQWEEVAVAIKEMVVRGAPAIGITAAYGLVLASQECCNLSLHEQQQHLEEAAHGLAQTRPTAVNLFWAIDRMQRRWKQYINDDADGLSLTKTLEQEAALIHLEDIETCRSMGAHGANLFDQPVNILTHCNTGALATGGHGTALGVIRSTFEQQKLKQVFADETRPFWQGARLTAWELQQDNIPVKVICDSMAAHFMHLGSIDAVFVGADRIAANGDTANKIGTYQLALVAQAHQVPFYVVAPKSTIDLKTSTGADIPIERRPDREVTHCGVQQVVPTGVGVENSAFDVTPAKLITGIITEFGVIQHGHFSEGLSQLFN